MAAATPFFVAPDATAELKQLYTKLDQKNTAPLWEALARLVTPQPVTPTQPALWRYSDIRPMLIEAGELITAEKAERRVLVLENPGQRGASLITQSLYAGIRLADRR